jgi:signal transduction histidine kinase
LEAAKTLWEGSPQDARGMLEQSLETTRSGLTETRRALQALRASPLEDLGLALALRGLAESIASRTGLILDLEIPDRLEVDSLSPGVEQGIYRIAQEALENVAKHAQAHRVCVSITQQGGRFAMTIADDGRGFEKETLALIHQYGLQGMRERTELLGGDLKVESTPGSGTTIRLAWGERT